MLKLNLKVNQLAVLESDIGRMYDMLPAYTQDPVSFMFYNNELQAIQADLKIRLIKLQGRDPVPSRVRIRLQHPAAFTIFNLVEVYPESFWTNTALIQHVYERIHHSAISVKPISKILIQEEYGNP